MKMKFTMFAVEIYNIYYWNYVIMWYFTIIFFQELKPTLDELGISLPEELGYDKPELMLQNPFLDNV